MDLPEEEGSPGIPAWVMTFADLMSLLMCFFVLLLSFSEIDAMKFKQIAGELSKAFGVQRDVAALEIPMGTSPIFDRPRKSYPSWTRCVRSSNPSCWQRLLIPPNVKCKRTLRPSRMSWSRS